MGSAVPIHCQKHWSSNTAARGHVASFIHEASSPPACAWERGGIILLPQLGTPSPTWNNLYFQFSCVSYDMFLPVLKFIPFSVERLSGSCQRGQVCIQTGLVWEVTQELIFSPVLSNSCCSVVLFLHSMKKNKIKDYDTHYHQTGPNVLIYCFAGVVLPFQRSISDNKLVCGNLEPEGHCLAETSIVTSTEQCTWRRECGCGWFGCTGETGWKFKMIAFHIGTVCHHDESQIWIVCFSKLQYSWCERRLWCIVTSNGRRALFVLTLSIVMEVTHRWDKKQNVKKKKEKCWNFLKQLWRKDESVASTVSKVTNC